MLWTDCLFHANLFTISLRHLNKTSAKHLRLVCQPSTAQWITANVHLTFSFLLDWWASFRFSRSSCLHQHPGTWLQKSLCSHQIICVVISCSIQQMISCFRREHPSASLLHLSAPRNQRAKQVHAPTTELENRLQLDSVLTTVNITINNVRHGPIVWQRGLSVSCGCRQWQTS